VDALAAFLWSEEGQRIFVKYGFRSVNEPLNQENPAFGAITDPFRIADLGGWGRAKKEIVDSVWKDRVLAELKK
jgi:ABC-type sulfate transport system substrate-binding protein